MISIRKPHSSRPPPCAYPLRLQSRRQLQEAFPLAYQAEGLAEGFELSGRLRSCQQSLQQIWMAEHMEMVAAEQCQIMRAQARRRHCRR